MLTRRDFEAAVTAEIRDTRTLGHSNWRQLIWHYQITYGLSSYMIQKS